jgi:hypothetical protein
MNRKKLDPLIPLDDLKKVVRGLVPAVKPKAKNKKAGRAAKKR